MIELLYPTQKLDGLTTSLVDISSETMKLLGSNGKKIALDNDPLLGVATNKVEKLREIQELYKSVLCDTKTTPEQKVKHVILLAKVAYKHIHDTEPTILQLGGVWVAHKECFEQNAEGLQITDEPESPIETQVLMAAPLPLEYADSHSCDGGDDDLFSGDEASPSHSSCEAKPDSATPLPSYSAVAGAVGLFAVAVYHLYTAYQESSSQELGPR